MDDYLAKPLRTRALRQALVRWGRADSNPPVLEESPIAAPAPAPDGRSFDRSLLDECCGGNSALIIDVLETFLRTTPASLSAIEAAVVAGSAGELEREAHRLKGACQTIGAGALAADCAMLLALARQGDLAAAPTALTALCDRWEQVRQDLCDYLRVLRND